MDEIEVGQTPCSLGLLVDSTAALKAAQRLYESPGQGLCHSGWLGLTVPRGKAAWRAARQDDADFDSDADE